MALQFCNGSKNEVGCKSDALERVRRFESHLQTQFAAQAGCHSVLYVSDAKYLDDQQNRERGYWFLTIDFVPYGLIWPGTAFGDLGPDKGRKQRWNIFFRREDMRLPFSGEGTPSEMAREICTIVLGHGAKIAR